jgi:hypothetical protein
MRYNRLPALAAPTQSLNACPFGLWRLVVSVGIVLAGCPNLVGCGGNDKSTSPPPSNPSDGGMDAFVDAAEDGPCTPKTCAQLGANCGVAPNGCGADVFCGVCLGGQVCGGGGANRCGEPPTGSDALCTQAGLSNTVIPLDWQGYKTIDIGKNQSVSFPLMISTASSGGRFTMSYTSGGTEIISISQTMCDFAQTLISSGCLTGGAQPNLTFQVPGSPYSNCTVTPGVQYYVNVRNAVMATKYAPKYPIEDSCTSGMCSGTMSYLVTD